MDNKYIFIGITAAAVLVIGGGIGIYAWKRKQKNDDVVTPNLAQVIIPEIKKPVVVAITPPQTKIKPVISNRTRVAEETTSGMIKEKVTLTSYRGW